MAFGPLPVINFFEGESMRKQAVEWGAFVSLVLCIETALGAAYTDYTAFQAATGSLTLEDFAKWPRSNRPRS